MVVVLAIRVKTGAALVARKTAIKLVSAGFLSMLLIVAGAKNASYGHRRSNFLVGISPNQQGPRDWLRQTAGAAAPSGGRERHEVRDRGGPISVP